MLDFTQVYVVDRMGGQFVTWDAFKAKGKIEHAIGDVAFIVTLQLAPNSHVIGVGLLEAKRIDDEGEFYSALDWAQLARESAGRSNHRVLLYDFTPIAGVALNLDTQFCCEHLTPTSFAAVHVAAVPTKHVLAMKVTRRFLGRYALPLSYQIVARFLRGFDLEYNSKLLDAIREGRPPLTKYVISASVSGATGGDVTPPVDINPDAYNALNEDDERGLDQHVSVNVSATRAAQLTEVDRLPAKSEDDIRQQLNQLRTTESWQHVDRRKIGAE